ncbi:MAG TPA: nuclear transport factor 2 family protein [Solirubrobacteraceae bacterium]|jgi:ketosteroid isomerase-like protein
MPSTEEDRQELARLEEAWMQAMQDRDEARLEELVAPEFAFTAIHIDPDPMSRAAWMGAALGGYSISSFYYDTMDVVVAGDTGVIHARYSQVATFNGRNLSSMFRLTDVWSRRDGRWQVVARHSSILS